MQKWSERKWWHWAILWTVAAAIGVLAGLSITSAFPTDDYGNSVSLLSKIFMFSYWSIIVFGFSSLVLLIPFALRTYRGLGLYHLAVVSETTGEVIAAECKKVLFRPLPFPLKYRVIEYPTVMHFYCPVQPMTQNPKVVPLKAWVAVALPPHNHTEPWLPKYLSNPEKFDKEFRRHAFDLLQHGLPQDLAGRLNPYDEHANAEFSAFVTNGLQRRLSIPVVVTNVRLEVQSR